MSNRACPTWGCAPCCTQSTEIARLTAEVDKYHSLLDPMIRAERYARGEAWRIIIQALEDIGEARR